MNVLGFLLGAQRVASLCPQSHARAEKHPAQGTARHRCVEEQVEICPLMSEDLAGSADAIGGYPSHERRLP